MNNEVKVLSRGPKIAGFGAVDNEEAKDCTRCGEVMNKYQNTEGKLKYNLFVCPTPICGYTFKRTMKQ